MSENINVPSSSDSSKKTGKLLIVDDDENIIKLLSIMFSKHYDLKASLNPLSALEFFKKGYKPDVILCDQLMPEMKGDEFLAETIKYAPKAIRIMLTSTEDPQDIVECINKGHVFLFVRKPFDSLKLIQTVKASFQHYRAVYNNENILLHSQWQVAEINKKNENLQQKVAVQIKRIRTQSIDTIAKLVNNNERYYYTNHRAAVREIALVLATEMDMSQEKRELIEQSASVHGIIYHNMPAELMLQDPLTIKVDNDLAQYFEFFNSSIAILESNDLLIKHAKILSQIWERTDGSGYPNYLSGMNISKEAQIIALANIYHNLVYRMNVNELSKLQEKGLLVQNDQETLARHNNVIVYCHNNRRTFSVDVMSAFMDIIKKRRCNSVSPISYELKIHSKNNQNPINRNFENSIMEDITENIELIEETNNNLHYQEQTLLMNKESDIDFIDMEIELKKVSSGMMVSSHIITKSGITVVRAGNKLDAKTLTNLKQLYEIGMLDPYISVQIPVDKSKIDKL